PAELGVEVVADGDVDQAVLACERHRGLGAVLRQREQAGSGATSHDDRDDVVRANGGPRHGYTSPKRSIGTSGAERELAAGQRGSAAYAVAPPGLDIAVA